MTSDESDLRVNKRKIIESVISGLVIAAVLGIISYAKFIPDIQTSIRVLGYKIEEHQNRNEFMFSNFDARMEKLEDDAEEIRSRMETTRADVVRLMVRQNMRNAEKGE